MKKIILNVGLNVGDKLSLSRDDVLAAVSSRLPSCGVIRFRVEQSETEQTAVVELIEYARLPTANFCTAVNRLACDLQQQCIAFEHGKYGYLVGPHAAEWGGVTFCPSYPVELYRPGFNPEYFIR